MVVFIIWLVCVCATIFVASFYPAKVRAAIWLLIADNILLYFMVAHSAFFKV